MRRCIPAVLFAVLAGCSGTGITSSGDDPDAVLRVTTTTGMIADLAANIGGDLVTVTALMGPGVDPHLYQATQGDLVKLRNADLILYNGLHLEGRMADVLEKLGERVPSVAVTRAVPPDRLLTPPEFEGQHDPHVWFDVSLWRFVAEGVRDSLIELRPQWREMFEHNAAVYIDQLDALHAYVHAQVASIPETQRVLVTAHDAFGYFGRAYDTEVIGLQGISTASEYGLRDLTSLVNLIVQRRIKAVFVETSIPRDSIDALVRGARARGHSVSIGGELFSDAMGAAGTPEGTYLGMVRHNVDTIVEALR
jgi:manganese/zinc/iron transport system substrate-binding protein